MAEESFQEKTEQPTPRKLEKARQEGNVARSIELPSTLILLTALAVFMLSGSWMFLRLSALVGSILGNAGTLRIDEASAQSFMIEMFNQTMSVLVPLMLCLLVAGFVGNVAQFGFLLTGKPLIPKFEKLNPISGIRKVFSLKSLVEVIKAVLKLTFVSTIAFIVLNNEMYAFPSLIQMDVMGILSFIGHVAIKICFFVCIALIFLSVLDFAYQRWQHHKNLRMTKQEVKEEARQSEGDPRIKGKIRRIQLETARRRMMQQVPEADVIVTNPTHIAIALKYKHEKMLAPQVIAKGADLVALRIRKIAEEHAIPIVENKTLARTLYKLVDLGDYIPVNLYKAVAEILAYVYNLNSKKQSNYR